MVHRDWEIWGPCGGYVAAIALRAAGAESPFARPASFFCHYLSVADFAPVDLAVTPLRRGRTVLAQRVEMTQEGRPVLDAMVWSVGQVEGLEHVDATPPEVSDPADTPAWVDRRHDADDDGRPYVFWDNFEQRTLDQAATWPPPGPLPPIWRTWVRYREGDPATEDAWVQAARLLVVLDVGSWPAGLAAPRPRRPALHCAQPRPLRRLLGSDERDGLALARHALAGGPGRSALVDGPGLVRDAFAAGQRRRPGRLPPHLISARGATRPCSRPSGPGCAA